MINRRNYYRLLQVQPDAPFEIIRASFRAMMRELKRHPDLGGPTAEAALLNQAYEVLSDSERREAYDRELFERYTKRLASRNPAAELANAIICPFCKTSRSRKEQHCRTCGSLLQEEQSDEKSRGFRRSVIRLKKDDRIRYYSAWPQKAREGRMVDISPRGMRFLCNEKIAKASILKVTSPTLKALAEVTNSQAQAEEQGSVYSVGLRFISVEFADAKGSFFSAMG